MNRLLTLHPSCATAILAALLSAPASAAPLAIVNGGFEADADNTAPPTGWTDLTPTSFWVGLPDETGNLSTADAATAGLNGNFLTAARQSAGAGSQPVDGVLVQTIDLTPHAAAIDGGAQSLFVDFDWASGDNRDTGVFSLSFYASSDGTGSAIGGGFTEPLDDADGFNIVSFHESVGGAVPAGARSVTLQLSTTRSGGSETNLWFDNFTGSIGTIPEPTSLALMLAGGLSLASTRRRS